MGMDMNISLDEIGACVSMLIQHAKLRGVTHVGSTKYDLHWKILSDEWVDLAKDPSVVTGSLHDDILELRNLLAEPSRASVVDLERVASILCLLSRILQDSDGYIVSTGEQRTS
jgi:hypothetical protein